MPVHVPQHDSLGSLVFREDLYGRRPGYAAGCSASPSDERGRRRRPRHRLRHRARRRAKRILPRLDRLDPLVATIPDSLGARIRIQRTEPSRRGSQLMPERATCGATSLPASERRHLAHHAQ